LWDPPKIEAEHGIEQKQDKLALQATPYFTLFFKIHRQTHIRKEKKTIKILNFSKPQ
jgi:hypothetical protein